MPIYLYVKTHNKTGLKYLGKTTQDPYRYKGSGKYWKLILKTEGTDHTTEIIKECDTIEELKEWGLYYSNLWDVVKSDRWANLKPEEGDGMAAGYLNPKYDSTIFKWQNINTMEIVEKTKRQMIIDYNLGDTCVSSVAKGKQKSVKGWILYGTTKYGKSASGDQNGNYNPTKYDWENIKTGEVVNKTRREMILTYSLSISGVSQVINGNSKSVNCWKILGVNLVRKSKSWETRDRI